MIMLSANNNIETLRKAYCPPIDDAVFYAISSDYELPKEQNELVKVLEILKESAFAEDDTTFDPSGTGGAVDVLHHSDTTLDEGSISNGVTSISTGASDLRWNEGDGFGRELEQLSDEGKKGWLRDLFPNVPLHEIVAVLKQSTSLEQATDELLNLAFIEDDKEHTLKEQVPVLKGVDGFAETIGGRGRKRRGKMKAKTTDSSRASSTGSLIPATPPSTPNIWATATDDVEFICSRTGLQPQIIKSIYHANGARLSSTIRALAVKEGAKWENLESVDPVVQFQIAELKAELPALPEAQVYGLLLLARNIPSAAMELLEAMTASTEIESTGKIHGFAQYAPLTLDKENVPLRSGPETPSLPLSAGKMQELATAHGIAASQAFTQASTAYKRGKSDRLMGGAAAYYSSVGHDRIKAARELQAAMANAHVSNQSSANSIDLHGVSVADAVRIAGNRTHSWWDALGDAKYTSGGGGAARAGFKIVTGLGTHSKNHAPRIGPAVTKMLVREGWRVEIGHGELTVTGKVRR